MSCVVFEPFVSRAGFRCELLSVHSKGRSVAETCSRGRVDERLQCHSATEQQRAPDLLTSQLAHSRSRSHSTAAGRRLLLVTMRTVAEQSAGRGTGSRRLGTRANTVG